MLKRNSFFAILFAIISSWALNVHAAADIKGQPENQWSTPLCGGKTGEDCVIDDTYDQRCGIIKILKPGGKNYIAAKNNVNDILFRYASNLYFEAIKTTFQIDQEKPEENKNSTSEQTLINRLVINRLTNIINRLNIIVSLEARTAVLENVNALSKVDSNVFSDYEYDQKSGECVEAGDKGQGE